MGKPAARMGDTTAHGGTVSLGLPTVMIGKMPAACLGDMHICPMCTPAVPPIPHVGGPITLGSTGVMIGKKPSARVSDITVCVGPPSMPAMGCMTVLVGEVGAAGGGGGAGAAAAAKAAATKGPKAASGFPLAEPPPSSESHFIECEFTDAAGNPLAGVPYRIKDPDKKEINGVTTVDGRVHHGGYVKSGGYEIFVPELKNAKWKKPKNKLGDPIEFEADADFPPEEKEAFVSIMECLGTKRRQLALLRVPLQGKKVKGTWNPEPADLEAEKPPEGSEPAPAAAAEPPKYEFLCGIGGLIAVSDSMAIVADLEIVLLDGDEAPIADGEYEMALPSGEVKKGKTDGSGKIKMPEQAPGAVDVRFPKLAPPAESVEAAPEGAAAASDSEGDAEPAEGSADGATEEATAEEGSEGEASGGARGSAAQGAGADAEGAGAEQETERIEVRLNDDAGHPLPGEAFRILGPAQEVLFEGEVDDEGYALAEIPKPESYTIVFPNLDAADVSEA